MRSSKLNITVIFSFIILLISLMACSSVDERTEDFANYICQYTDSIALSRCNDSICDRFIEAFHDDSVLFNCWIRDLHYDYDRRMKLLYKKAEIIHSLDSLYNRPLSNEEAVKNIGLIYDKYNTKWPVGAKYVMARRYIEGFTETKTHLYQWEDARKKLGQEELQKR